MFEAFLSQIQVYVMRFDFKQTMCLIVKLKCNIIKSKIKVKQNKKEV